MSRVQFDLTTPVDDQGQTVSTSVELPELWVWAHEKFADYSDAQIDQVIQEWHSEPRTRNELYWLEGVLARRQGKAAGWSAELSATMSGGSGARLSANADRWCCSA